MKIGAAIAIVIMNAPTDAGTRAKLSFAMHNSLAERREMRYTILAFAALISACSGPRVVSIPVSCVDSSDIPAEPPKVQPQLTGHAALDVSTLAISALLLRQYASELRALLRGCE